MAEALGSGLLPPQSGLAMPRRVWAIAAISFGNALVTIDGSIATVALPTIARDLGVDASAAVLIVTVYQLILVMTLLPMSALGDRIGHRTLYQYGQLTFTVATILCFFANSLPFLLVVRAVQALGAAAALSVSSAMIRAIYPPEALGRGLGFNTVVVASAASLAPTLGGLVVAVAPWPYVFAAAVPLAIVSLLLGRSLPDPSKHDEPYDVLAAVLCAATFGLVISGLESGVHGDSPVVSGAIVATGLVVAAIFVRRELAEERPIMPVDLLSQPVMALSIVGGLTASIASMTLTLSIPFRLQHGAHFGPGEVGAVLAAWPLTSLVVAPIAGTLSDKIPAGLLGGIGMAVSTIALILLMLLPDQPGTFDVIWRLSLCGAGFGMFLSPNARLVVGSAPSERAAAAGAMVSTTRLTGQTLGATLVAVLLSMGLGTGPLVPIVCAGLAVVAGLCSLARLNPALRRPPAGEVEEVVQAPPVR